LILFKILKLFGLDVPARFEAAKASLELRIEEATDHVKQVAQDAAVVAALSAVAAAAAALAIGVGLIALFIWIANVYGVFGGLAAVGGLLLLAAVIFAIIASAKARSLSSPPRLTRYTSMIDDTDNVAPSMASSATAMPAPSPRPPVRAPMPATAVPAASASDLIEPLGFMLSRFLRFPTIGNPVVDELIGNLASTARGSADEAIERAAAVVRDGNRANLFIVLTGAAFAGWMLTHHSRE
jgi:hypothetical protein